MWLEDAYFNLRDVTFSRDKRATEPGGDQSFVFALSYAVEKYPGVVREFEEGEGAGHNRFVLVDKIFKSGNKDFIAAIADGAREYYKNFALTYIDMLGAGELASTQIQHTGGGKISVRDRIIELSRNFVSEKVGAGSIPLEQRFLAAEQQDKNEV